MFVSSLDLLLFYLDVVYPQAFCRWAGVVLGGVKLKSCLVYVIDGASKEAWTSIVLSSVKKYEQVASAVLESWVSKVALLSAALGRRAIKSSSSDQ